MHQFGQDWSPLHPNSSIIVHLLAKQTICFSMYENMSEEKEQKVLKSNLLFASKSTNIRPIVISDHCLSLPFL